MIVPERRDNCKIMRERNKDGTFKATHGMRGERLYKVWEAMKRRCKCPSDKSYRHYGMRGIKVCEEWESFSNFCEWAMSNGYVPGLTIDRINRDGNYEPGNCRWATYAQQNRNYSRNHLITYHGETKCVADWATETGIKRATILFRLKSGKSLDEVFSTIDGRTTRWQKTTSRSCTR